MLINFLKTNNTKQDLKKLKTNKMKHEKLIYEAHENLTRKVSKKDYSPTMKEIEGEIKKPIDFSITNPNRQCKCYWKIQGYDVYVDGFLIKLEATKEWIKMFKILMNKQDVL